MRKDSIKKILLILFIVALMLSTLMPVFAVNKNEPDLSRNGSISISLNDGDTALSSAEITLYRVTELVKKGSIFEYAFVDTFASSGVSADDLSDEQTAELLSEYAKSNKIGGISAKTDKKGHVKFDELELGMYLAVQTGSVQGFADCTPFLISVPLNDLGNFIYDVDATPKTDIARLVDVTVKKVWNDNGKKHPNTVTVQLMKGTKVIETVNLSEQNNWSYKWTDIPSSDSYSVQEINMPKDYTATYKQNGFDFTVINTSTLIKTGQLNWPVPLMAGVGLFLFVIGWIIVFLKEEKKA